MQVLPKDIAALPADQQRRTRLLVYESPYNASGKGVLPRLRVDLEALAESQGEDPVRVVGLAYTGERNSNSKLVDPAAEGLPEGVKVTQMQLDKARDILAAMQDMITDTNAEIIGFSAGGPVAQIAAELGLSVDTIGLFNATSLDNKGHLRTTGRTLLGVSSLITKLLNRFKGVLKLEERTENRKFRFEPQEVNKHLLVVLGHWINSSDSRTSNCRADGRRS